MPYILMLAGFVFLLYVLSRFMQQSASDKMNRIVRIAFAVILGGLAFLILLRGNPAGGGILGLLSFLSAQGSLWKFLVPRQPPALDEKDKKPTYAGSMSREEALDILGFSPSLAESPSPDEIRAAHRRMMAKMHPDQGGSDYFASKLNQARDILL